MSGTIYWILFIALVIWAFTCSGHEVKKPKRKVYYTQSEIEELKKLEAKQEMFNDFLYAAFELFKWLSIAAIIIGVFYVFNIPLDGGVEFCGNPKNGYYCG